MPNYYQTLGLHPTAPQSEISRRFRILALTHHPSKAPVANTAQANWAFAGVCEAYEVLSNGKSTPWQSCDIAELRSIYDKYGEDLLKNGVPGVVGPEGQQLGGYRFTGNTQEIFEKFFGTGNAFAVAIDGKFKYEFERYRPG